MQNDLGKTQRLIYRKGPAKAAGKTVPFPRRGVSGRQWLARLEKVVLQNPLMEYKPSLAAVRSLSLSTSAPPQAVFLGLGLSTTSELSASLPVDFFGMLLPAEEIRQAVGAHSLVVVVADEHAITNRLPRGQVEKRAQETVHTLWKAKSRLSLSHLHIVRASDFHGTNEYQSILARVDRRAPTDEHLYFKKEVADIAFLDRMYGGIIKVGWTVNPSVQEGEEVRDEVAFDRRFQRWMGRKNIPFVYCKAGRVLCDAQPKAPPYVEVLPSRRICLHPEENVAGKLAQAETTVSQGTIRGVRKHLKAVTRCFNKMVMPLQGPVEERVQSLIGCVFGPQGAVTGPRA